MRELAAAFNELSTAPSLHQSNWNPLLRQISRNIKLFLFAILIFTKSGNCEELPVIQLPDYVISGVEKATAILGERVSTTAIKGDVLPEEVSSQRPEFALSLAEVSLEMPGVLAPLGTGNVRVSVLGGMRSWGEVDASIDGQKLPVGYRANLHFASPRTTMYDDPIGSPATGKVGIRSDNGFEGDYARDISNNSLFNAGISFSRQNVGRFVHPNALIERSISNFSLDANSSPILIGSGSLTGRFEYAVNSMRGDGEVSNTLDHLTLSYSRRRGPDLLEFRSDFVSELVNGDKNGHNLMKLEAVAHRQLANSLHASYGLMFYLGSEAEWDSIPASVVSNSGSGLNVPTDGVLPTANLDWMTPFGGVASLGFRPEVTFVRLRDIASRYPVLDTLARGATMQSRFRFTLGYQRHITANARFGVEIETRADKDRPYIVPAGADFWTVVLRKSEATITTLRGDFDFPHQIGFGCFLRLTDEQAMNGMNSENAPLVSPTEFGAEFTMPLREKVTFAQQVTYLSAAPVDFIGTTETKAGAIWDASIRWRIREGLTTDFGIHNLLDQPINSISGYQADRFALWAKIEWRGLNPFVN